MLAKLLSTLRTLRFGPAAWLLAAVNLALLGSLGAILLRGNHAESILATAGKTPATAAIDLQVPALAMDLEVIQAQPIFHTSRSFYVPPDPTVVAVQVIPPDYRIAGAMSLPKRPVIAFLVHNQTGARARVQKGDVLDGWEVQDVSSQRVALVQNDNHAEITSAKPAGAAPGMIAGMFTGPQNAGQPIPGQVNAAQVNGAQTNVPQGGLRILSAGPAAAGRAQGLSNANSNANALPKAPPGGVGARLYRPPPGQ